VEAIGQLVRAVLEQWPLCMIDRRNEARFTFQYNLKDMPC
jgi:hypothetical protein